MYHHFINFVIGGLVTSRNTITLKPGTTKSIIIAGITSHVHTCIYLLSAQSWISYNYILYYTPATTYTHDDNYVKDHQCRTRRVHKSGCPNYAILGKIRRLYCVHNAMLIEIEEFP